jgi:hypothetical protein
LPGESPGKAPGAIPNGGSLLLALKVFLQLAS